MKPGLYKTLEDDSARPFETQSRQGKSESMLRGGATFSIF
jgi:hypothetical protein